MGEESDAADYNLLSYTGPGGVGVGDRDDARVSEWEIGLPSGDDLTPLSQSLIPPELASAFSISPEPEMTVQEVIRASHRTLSILRNSSSSSVSPLKSFSDDPMVVEADEPAAKLRRCNSPPPQASVSAADGESSGLIRPETALKRPRLVWTPQLHKRFVEVVAHVGVKSAVPKTIMQLMNVEGLTRENVASHLQKYRLYLKRMNGLSDEGPSSSDQLFASTPVPPTLQEPALPVPYSVPTMIPMPVYGVPHHRGHGPPVGMVPVVGSHHGFESHFGESLAKDRPGAGGSRIGSSVRYPGVRPNDKVGRYLPRAITECAVGDGGGVHMPSGRNKTRREVYFGDGDNGVVAMELKIPFSLYFFYSLLFLLLYRILTILRFLYFYCKTTQIKNTLTSLIK